MLELYEPIVERALKDHCSLLGFKGDELIAVSLHSIRNVNTSELIEQPNVDMIPERDYSSSEWLEAPIK